MFIDKDSIKINEVSIGEYLVEAKFGYNKLWGEDSGRNLNGDMVATLVGIYPKITLQFRKLTKSELELITPMLDSSRQTLTYYDPTKHQTISITTYSGDYEIINKRIIHDNSKNEGFSCSLISVSKRR